MFLELFASEREMNEYDVIVVGAGPAGLVSAAALANDGHQVLVLEGNQGIERNLRGSTFHPSTLDMLEAGFGVASQLRQRGLEAPLVQYRRHGRGKIAEFDFGDIRDRTEHPFRVQAEQYKLCEALYDYLKPLANVSVRFSAHVSRVELAPDCAEVFLDNGVAYRSRYVVGADGAGSQVRKSMDVQFEGFTWPERFLVVSTPFDFASSMPDLASVSYVADSDEWYFLLRVPELWRVMFPIEGSESDEIALDGDRIEQRLQRVCPRNEPYTIAHTTLYNVHQRVASNYREGRAVLVGDAAHVNNPLGGMGMNGGIHDAFNLAEKLTRVLDGSQPDSLLDKYDDERRGVALRYVQEISIQNKRDLEAKSVEAQRQFETRLTDTASDIDKRRSLLLRLSMISSLATDRH